MATSYTSLLGLALPVTGELSGTWGDTVNNYISNYIDAAVAGAQTVTTDTTLTKTTGASLGSTSSQYAIIIASPASANITITAPAASKIYTIINTSATYTVKIVGAGPTTGVTLGVSEKAQVAWNGSDFVRIGASGGPGIFSSITNTGLTSGRVVFSSTGGLEADSANLVWDNINAYLGIGTSSPGSVLDVRKSAGSGGFITYVNTSAYANTNVIETSYTLNNANSGLATAAVIGVTNPAATGNSYGDIYFKTATPSGISEKMRLDSSGNLGLGVTPSAWFSTWKGFQIGATGSLASRTDVFGTILSNNAFINAAGNNAYIGTGSAAGYSLIGNEHRWNIAPSGTAGNAITFTQAMTLDSSGNLGLGGTPSAWSGTGNQRAIQISTVGSISSLSNATGNQQLSIGRNVYEWFAPKYITSDTASAFRMLGDNTFAWYTAPSGNAGDPITFTQAMTLGGSGNLGIGTTSPNQKLELRVDTTTAGNEPNILLNNRGLNTTSTTPYSIGGVYGAAFRDIRSPGYVAGMEFYRTSTSSGLNSAGDIRFYTGGNDAWTLAELRASFERMRLDSSGNLLLGTTSGAERLCVIGTTNNYAIKCNAANTSGTYYQISFLAGATGVGSITSTTSATAYNTSSDYRLKNSIAPMTGALDKVAALKPVTYKWNIDGSDGEGFIAHELAEVCPHAVTGEKDAVNEDGSIKSQGIDTSFLVATLTAALQEAHSLIKDLQTRVAQLEAK